MELQLKKSGIEVQFTKNINLDWALKDVSRLIKQYSNNEYFLYVSKKILSECELIKN